MIFAGEAAQDRTGRLEMLGKVGQQGSRTQGFGAVRGRGLGWGGYRQVKTGGEGASLKLESCPS